MEQRGFLEGMIHGEDAHGARPHQGVNAIDVISMINIGLKIFGRHRKVPIQ